MKTFKQEARQFASSVLAGVMLFGTMFGSSTAFADEALPEVENSPVIIVDPSEQPYQAYGSRLVSADSLFPGLVVLSADNSDFAGTSRDLNNVSSVKITIDGLDYDLPGYGYVENLNLFIINPSIAFNMIYHDVVPSIGTTYVPPAAWSDDPAWAGFNSVRTLSKNEYDLCKELLYTLNPDCELHLMYDDGASIDVPVTLDVGNKYYHVGRMYHASNNALIVTLPDSKNITDRTFYDLENAISIVDDSNAFANKYYVNIDSEDDLVIPIESAPRDAFLSEAQIGPMVVYKTSSAADFNSARHEEADGATEAGTVYRFDIPLESGGSVRGFATDDRMEQLVQAIGSINAARIVTREDSGPGGINDTGSVFGVARRTHATVTESDDHWDGNKYYKYETSFSPTDGLFSDYSNVSVGDRSVKSSTENKGYYSYGGKNVYHDGTYYYDQNLNLTNAQILDLAKNGYANFSVGSADLSDYERTQYGHISYGDAFYVPLRSVINASNSNTDTSDDVRPVGNEFKFNIVFREDDTRDYSDVALKFYHLLTTPNDFTTDEPPANTAYHEVTNWYKSSDGFLEPVTKYVDDRCDEYAQVALELGAPALNDKGGYYDGEITFSSDGKSTTLSDMITGNNDSDDPPHFVVEPNEFLTIRDSNGQIISPTLNEDEYIDDIEPDPNARQVYPQDPEAIVDMSGDFSHSIRWLDDSGNAYDEEFDSSDPVHMDSISWTAYDGRTFEYVIRVLNAYGLVDGIDFSKSYIPDFYSDNGAEIVPIRDILNLSEETDFVYTPTSGLGEGTDGQYPLSSEPKLVEGMDMRDYAGRSAYNVFGDNDLTLDKGKAVGDYVNGELRVKTAALSGIEKGVTYNVNLQFIGAKLSGILYQGGDLLNGKYGWADYLDYKWGEMIFASCPSVSENLSYKDGKLTWTRPVDEGLGTIINGRGKTDDYIYLTKYRVEVKDMTTDTTLLNKEITADGKLNQSMDVDPELVSNGDHNYEIRVYAANALGESKAAVYKIDKIERPELTVEKTADKTYYNADETVIFTDVVTNTGNIDLTKVALTEDLPGKFTAKDSVTITGFTATIGKLAVGESASVEYKVNASETAVNDIVNSTVYAASAEGAEGQDNCQVRISSTKAEVTKTGDKTEAKVGDVVTYTDEVTNTGTQDLHDVVLQEYINGQKATGDNSSVTVDTIAAGKSFSFTYKANVTESENDIFVSTVKIESSREGVKGEASFDTNVIKPSIKVVTTPEKTNYLNGDEVLYTEVVTNNGNTTLKNVNITESVEGIFVQSIGTVTDGKLVVKELAAGQTVSFIYKAKASKNSLSKTLEATANDGTTDKATATITLNHPAITITKAADKAEYSVGDVITYTSVIKNTGDCDLTGLVVSENLPGAFTGDITGANGTAQFGKLAIGETKTYNYVVKASAASDKLHSVVTVNSNEKANATAEADVVVNELKPAISVTKTASKGEYAIGEDVVFTSVVINNGDCDLTNVKIVEDLTGTFTGKGLKVSGKTATLDSLAEGASFTYTYRVSAKNVAPDENRILESNVNVSTKEGVDAQASARVKIAEPIVIVPGVQVKKTAEDKIYAIGEDVVYTVVITNIGNCDLTGVRAIEDLPGTFKGVAGSNKTAVIDELKQGRSITYTYTVAGSDIHPDAQRKAASTVNVSSKEGAFDSSTVTIEVEKPFETKPSIEITKSADKTSYEIGDKIVYTSKVSNTGNVDLTKIKLIENLSGSFDKYGPVIDKLEAGKSVTYTYTVDAAAVGTVHSTVDAVASEGATAHAETDVTVVDSSVYDLNVTKTAEKSGYYSEETAVFVTTVTNTGNRTLTNIKLEESIAGTFDGTEPTIAKLDAGESVTYKYLVKVSDVSGNVIADKVIATADHNINKSAEAKADILAHNVPNITVSKTVDVEKISWLDDVNVVFTDVVTNTGNVALTDVVVFENLKGTFENGEDEFVISNLAVGESVTLKYTVTDADTSKDYITSTVTAKNNAVKASASLDVSVVHPKVTVTKTPASENVRVGDEIVYLDVVTNVGDIDLTNVVVTENLPGTFDVNPVIPSLPAGESVTLAFTVKAGKSGVLTSTVDVTSNEGAKAQATCNLDVINPSIEVAKTADKTEYTRGDVIVFTDTITNTGDVTLHNLKLDENLKGTFGTADLTALEPGKTVKVTYTVDTKGVKIEKAAAILNSKVVVNCDENVTDDASMDVVVMAEIKTETPDIPEPSTPGIKVDKIPDKDEYTTGDTVIFTDIVENTGDVILHNVVVKENLPGSFDPHEGVKIVDGKVIIDELEPGEKISLIYRVPNVQPDENGYITSTVTVTSDECPDTESTSKVKVTTPVEPSMKLKVTKVPDKDDYNYGDNIVFTETVENPGEVTLHNVVITENLKGTFTPNEKIKIVDGKVIIDELKPGEKVEFKFTVKSKDLDLKDGDNKITSTMHAACDEGIEAEDTRTVNVRKTAAPTTTPTTTTTSQPNKTAPAEPSVQTGDVRNVWVYMLICFAAVGVFAVAYGRKRED